MRKATDGPAPEYRVVNAGSAAFAIVTSRFNALVTDRLAAGAREALIAHGVAAGEIHDYLVAGAWELAPVVAAALDSGRFRAVIACGAVVRGETPHFEHIARAVADALARVQLERRRPVGFAVLTTDTLEQALERAGGKVGNRGEEAAIAALEAADVLDSLAD